MRTKNTDVPLEIASMIDAQVRLFDQDYSLTEILNMDIPFKRSLILARITALSRSRQRLKETGEVDAYSKRDLENGLFKGITSSSPTSE